MNILLTGATGYIGRRLLLRLREDADVSLRVLVRNAKKLNPADVGDATVIEGDTFKCASLVRALKGIDVAYYLINLTGAGRDFSKLERQSAEIFRDICIEFGVKRIIYLSGVGSIETASPQLRTKIEAGNILSRKPDRIQTIWIRSGLTIGSGSVTFEMIEGMLERLPFLILPSWTQVKTNTAFVTDVVEYLCQAKDLALDCSSVIDIGAVPLTFREMIEAMGNRMGVQRPMISIPFEFPRLSTYWLSLFTSIPYRIASVIVAGIRSGYIIDHEVAAACFPSITPQPFDEAVRRAFIKVETDQVVSRWCDSSAGEVCDVNEVDESANARYRDETRSSFGALDPSAVFRAVKSIGGKAGWFTFGFLWKIRGLVDKLVGGYGTARGRRAESDLRIGDKLDFWEVVDLQENRRMLLEAQMKVPGRAWLEFTIHGTELVITAYFTPEGLLGKIYWYSLVPSHHFVFKDLIKSIIKKAASL
ncbi:MAG TPA: SDR family oxidoreductase [Dissulfurispiraceae bacterium]|nr:SDR family oxidoreductase [Dissulfurispiraceae bacterium]